MQASDLGVTGFAFGGGEPFAVPWFIDLLEYLDKKCRTPLSVTSNATRITPSLAERLQMLKIEVRISINSIKEYGHRKEALELLLKCSIRTGINVLIARNNLDLWQKILPDLMKDKRIQDLLMLKYQTIGRDGFDVIEDTRVKLIINQLIRRSGIRSLKFSSSYSSLLEGNRFKFPPQLTQSKNFFASIGPNKTLRHTSFCPSSCEINLENDFKKAWNQLKSTVCSRVKVTEGTKCDVE